MKEDRNLNFYFTVRSDEGGFIYTDLSQVLERISSADLVHGVRIRILNDLDLSSPETIASAELRAEVLLVKANRPGLNFFATIWISSPEFYDDAPTKELAQWLKERQRGVL